MENISTEEFLMKELKGLGLSSKLIEQNKFKAIAILNRFGQMHVKAYKEKIENIMVSEENEKNSVLRIHNDILNAYPLTNIK